MNQAVEDFRRRMTGREHEVESCCDGGRQGNQTSLNAKIAQEIVESARQCESEGIELHPIYRSDDPQSKQVGGEHYKGLAIEPVEYCQRNKLGYCESNAVKYVTRHRLKGGKQDLQKAIHYLELLLKLEYGG